MLLEWEPVGAVWTHIQRKKQGLAAMMGEVFLSDDAFGLMGDSIYILTQFSQQFKGIVPINLCSMAIICVKCYFKHLLWEAADCLLHNGTNFLSLAFCKQLSKGQSLAPYAPYEIVSTGLPLPRKAEGGWESRYS